MPNVPAKGLHQATAFISRSALRNNAKLAASIAGSNALLCMVKANAYGHGIVETALTLNDLCWGFGVARCSEGAVLRDAGIDKPIVVMSDYSIQYDIDTIRLYRLTPTLYCEKHAAKIAQIYRDNHQPYWLKINTGMHRLGLNTIESADLATHAEVIATHLHSSGEVDRRPTELQLEKFVQSLSRFDQQTTRADNDNDLANQGEQPMLSFANSAALLYQSSCANYKRWKAESLGNIAKSHNEIVRPGIMLYGANPLAEANDATAKLCAAMTLAAPIVDIQTLETGASVGYNANWCATRPSVIATVAIGYGDGYPRHAVNGTPVYIGGEMAKLAGTVSMDMIGVDITDLLIRGIHIDVGDTAVLWGEQLAIETIAESASTISYDLMTGVSARVNRNFLD